MIALLSLKVLSLRARILGQGKSMMYFIGIEKTKDIGPWSNILF
jgi:hypothetical protein